MDKKWNWVLTSEGSPECEEIETYDVYNGEGKLVIPSQKTKSKPMCLVLIDVPPFGFLEELAFFDPDNNKWNYLNAPELEKTNCIPYYWCKIEYPEY